MSEDEPREIKRCWGCDKDLKGELVTHPFRVRENQREITSPFPMIVYYDADLCDECQSKRRNI